MNVELLNRLLAPLRNRVAKMVARAVVRLVDDDKKFQELQVDVLDTETRDGVERFQQYGFTSVPEDGAEAVLLCVGGRREHAIAIAVDHREHRLKGLEGGEVALYHKDGAKVVLKASGDIEVTPKSGSDVVLAGGSAQVARVGDATAGHTHTFTFTTPNAGVTYNGTTGSSTDTIDEGAAHVKA